MIVAVIGAGPAGLTSARNLTKQGLKYEIYESASDLGGQWLYTDHTIKDEYGYPVHSSMYKNLKCNLPKETMEFPDFPFPEYDESFLGQPEILTYLNQYADHFSIRKFIRFNEFVTKICPVGQNWEITSVNKKTKDETIKRFDTVMVCNGHYSTPNMPIIEGEETFNGDIIHSHFYRIPDKYQSKKILILGTGPSGLDLVLQLSNFAKSLTISGKLELEKYKVPDNATKKPKITRMAGNKIEFLDGSYDYFDSIIYCTGYKNTYPFFDKSCGIEVHDNYVTPLYKQIINIQHPTMCFIGLLAFSAPFHLFDFQARFYCQYLNGTMALPTKEKMIQDMEKLEEKITNKGYRKKDIKQTWLYNHEYLDELSRLADITRIPPVFGNIGEEKVQYYMCDIAKFRKCKYRILNNSNYQICEYEK